LDGSRIRVQQAIDRDLLEHDQDCAVVARVEEFLFDKLCRGAHPDHFDREVREEMSTTPYDTYKRTYLNFLLGMLSRLRQAGSYIGLPNLADLDAVERIWDKRIVLEKMIRDRFMEQDMESMAPLQLVISMFFRSQSRCPCKYL
jgi:hypothetical protein